MAVTTFSLVDSHVRPFCEYQNTCRYHASMIHSHYFIIYFLAEEQLGKKRILVRSHARSSKITDILGAVAHKGTVFWI
jgi:hypothetical protein